MEEDLGPLGRLAADLHALRSQTHKGRTRSVGDGGPTVGDLVHRAAAGTAGPLARLSSTLRELERGLAGAHRKGGRRPSRFDDDVGGDEDAGASALSIRASDVVAWTGPWLSWSDRESLFRSMETAVGIDRYFDRNDGLWVAHLADALYFAKTGWRSFESRFAKLNYPHACRLTVRSDDPVGNVPKDLSNSERGRWSVAVVGLRGHGKSALCGRLVQALGGVSGSARGRVRAAARRSVAPGEPPDPCIDAVWSADRRVEERQGCTTTLPKPFLLHHRELGSFNVLDTPPFVTQYEDRGTGIPQLGPRRMSTVGLLQLCRPACIICCISVTAIDDMNLDALTSLVVQAVASTGPGLSLILFAVTNMDAVSWNEQAFDRAQERIRLIMEGFQPSDSLTVKVVPTSAAVPGFGILSSGKTRHWTKQPLALSVASAIKSCTVWEGRKEISTDQKDGEGNDFLCAVAKFVRFHHTNEIIVEVAILRGSVGLKDLLWTPNKSTRIWDHRKRCYVFTQFAYTVENIELFHESQNRAYAGQLAGLHLKFQLPENISDVTLSKGSILSGEVHTDESKKIVNVISWHTETVRIRLRLLYDPPAETFTAYAHNAIFELRFTDLQYLSLDLQCDGQGRIADVSAMIFGSNKLDPVFLSCEQVVLYHGDRLLGFGIVTKSFGDTVLAAGWRAELTEQYLKMNMPVLHETADAIEQSRVHGLGALHKPAPVHTVNRGVSWPSTVSSASLRDLHGFGERESSWTETAKLRKKLHTGPAQSIGEAINQADVLLASVSRLRDQLEKAKLSIDHIDHGLGDACYMCNKPCSASPDPLLVPLCSGCAALNTAKRTARLGFDRVHKDHAFVVTGARIKIGYATVCRLLAEGAQLLVLTTRFPHSLAEKLVKERPRGLKNAVIHIYGADFRNAAAVTSLGRHIAEFYPKVFALVNNAAQTVRRPAAFYVPLVEKELELARNPGHHSKLVQRVGHNPFADTCPPSSEALVLRKEQVMQAIKTMNDCNEFQPCASALMTQCPVMEEDGIQALEKGESELFPLINSGKSADASTGEIVTDNRSQTSWTKSLLPSEQDTDTVHPVECLEVLLVNTLAPFILIKSLCNSLAFAQGSVVNVSSREGVFARVKQAEHPHSNMSKAALNMLTRTSAYELKRIQVMICSVDTGWVTNNRPATKHDSHGGSTSGKRRLPPLVVEDAASRILDPIAQRMDDPERIQTGVFWRNFKAVPFM